MQQLSAKSSEDARHSISHEKGSLSKLCSWSWGIHSSKLSLIKEFCRGTHKEQSVYLRTPKICQAWGWRHRVLCFVLFFSLMLHYAPWVYSYLSFTCVLHEALFHAPGSGAVSPWSLHALCCGRLSEKQPLYMPHAVRLSLAVYALADCRASERKVDREQGCSGCSCTSWCV